MVLSFGIAHIIIWPTFGFFLHFGVDFCDLYLEVFERKHFYLKQERMMLDEGGGDICLL